MNLLEHLKEQGIQYVPELYRQQLINLMDLDSEPGCDWIDTLESDVSEIKETLSRKYSNYLAMGYQEGLYILKDLDFFLGFADSISSPVGGKDPVMHRDCCDGACVNWGL
tara:strand:+ start:357 stop:686 length:330 start_codon:yes stop_codon:yes gene_type:complete